MTDPFAGFVVDAANTAAATAARTAADIGRALYAPLVIIGPPGSGKSHLLRAIRERGAAATPPRQVELISLERLAELLHLRGFGEGARALRDRLVAADLLLIDDFESVARQLPAQAIVFDLLESRLAARRDVVIATAEPPASIRGLDARLGKRLEAGTTVGLSLPGPEARRVILERRITESRVPLDPGVAAALARHELTSVREYLGALGRVLAFQQAAAAPLGAADALSLLGLDTGVPDRPANGAMPRTTVAPPEQAAAADDGSAEFDAFLSDVVANVTEQFDHWRTRLGEVIGHWQARGVRTRRLERAVSGETGGDPEPLITEFGRDASELERLAEEARVLAPDLAGAEVLRDPDQLAAARALLEEARARRAPLSAPLAELTLEGLAIGRSNRVAVEAARALVQNADARPSPLVIVGAAGVGKTHLLHGVGNALVARGLSPVACLSAHSFLGEVGAARTPEELSVWRTRYQWVAALALDDLHLLAHEARAQEELLHTFSALASGGRAMVLTSARRLPDLEGFDARLLSRLEGGLVVELLPPDREVRLSVARAMLAGMPGGDDAALLDYLASRPADSVRAVQGAVQRVMAGAAAQRAALSPALARETLDVVPGRVSGSGRRHPPRASGLLAPGPAIARSREKMVLRWPDPADRFLPELR